MYHVRVDWGHLRSLIWTLIGKVSFCVWIDARDVKCALCWCRGWAYSAIRRYRSTRRAAIFVGNSRDMDDIDFREHVDLGWEGALQVVRGSSIITRG